LNKFSHLKTIRELLALKQEFVAFQIGIEQSELSRIENGKRMMKADEIKKLSNLYGCSADLIIDSNGLSEGSN
jgi:transcriptional regulator with XRE-family HTH domain